jgi:FtsP/CotA-like multicopper oxidase with cupredoxin domain
MSIRSSLIVTGLVGALVGALVASAAWLGLPQRSGAVRADALVDRAAIESLLADEALPATGKTARIELAVEETKWELLPGVSTTAVTFNRTVPGPLLRVTEGDAVEISVTNRLAEPTSVHWHGLHVPNAQDGVAGITQEAIAPGATFLYRFSAPHAGTFMYHAHGPNSREQIDRGLYGALVIDPQGIDPLRADREYILALQGWMIDAQAMDAMSMGYNYFTVNGKSYPATQPIVARPGELVRLRFINPSQTIHPMHLHGTDMAIVAKDGEALAMPQRINTVTLNPGETYDVVFRADNPGRWVLHCHDLHHASNDGVEPGGLVLEVRVGDETAPAAPKVTPSPARPTPMPSMPGMGR